MPRIKPHLLSLGFTLVIVAAIGIVSYRDWHNYDEMALAAQHAHTVIDQTEDLLSLLKDTETGQRGFLLTGNDEYLTTYHAAVPKIAERLEQLNSHMAHTDSAQAAATLKQLSDEKLAELAETIRIREHGDLTAAITMVRTNAGKATMDKIRTTAAKLITAETDEFTAQQSSARAHANQTRDVVLIGSIILAVLLIGAAFQVSFLIGRLEHSRLQEYNQKATLSTTLESIGDAVIATDPKGIVTFLNPVAANLTGWRSDPAVGQPLGSIFRIVNEDTHEPIESPADKVFREGTVVGLANHTLLVTREGAEIPIDDSGAPIRAVDGNVTGAVLVFRDISERRIAEREMAESERRYRLLFENNPGPMWVYDHKTLKFLAVNNAAVQTYGYTREEFLSMTLLDIRSKEDAAKLRDGGVLAPTELSAQGVWVHRRKNGTAMLVEITDHPLVFDGHDAGLVLATDVTERKRMEQQFNEAQRMESVGRLAGGVAHDFNNLLTVINGYSEMILAELPENSPLHADLAEIRAAGQRAASLTQQLLAFSRRQIVQPTILNPNQVVHDIEKMLRRLIGEDIDFVTKLAPDLGHIKADAGQLQQIIVNLAVNSRDAMPAGGTLMVETANAEFDENYIAFHGDTRPGSYVMLAVSDSGTGMTPEVKERIFEPFFTTKPTGHGTGLGLATVYGMVKQAGGWIWVYSELGHGTTFKVYFPRTDAPVMAEPATSKADARGTETVLLVEDQPEVRNFAVTALKKCGYTVHQAANGADAIAFSRDFDGNIDLLVTDVVMPGMTGREVADALRNQRSTLKVLFMSGYTQDTIAHRGVLDAGVDYLQKPFTPELLATKVRAVLNA